MASKPSLINNITWHNAAITQYYLITSTDNRYLFLKDQLIDRFFPILDSDDKKILLDGLILLVNVIYHKFGFSSNKDYDTIFWYQLCQNDLLDLRALLNLMLPFIDDNENDDKKKSLHQLKDIYLKTNPNGT